MARKQTQKKLVSFVNIELIDQLIKDEAMIKNCSESAVIEDRLLDSYLPSNKQARFLCEQFLYSDIGSVARILSECFSWLSAGINWESQYDNALPLVKFACHYSSAANTILTGKEMEIHHMCSQLESLQKKLKLLSEREKIKSIEYSNDTQMIKYLIDTARKEPKQLRLVDIYYVVINNWECLKKWSITYRLLSDVSILDHNMCDNEITRSELVSILKEISVEWS